jgi:hypothetical protein
MKSFLYLPLFAALQMPIFAQSGGEQANDQHGVEFPEEILDYIEKYGFEKVPQKATVLNEPSEVYTVPLQMDGNRLTLVLANTTSSALREISVRAVTIPEGVNMKPGRVQISEIEPGSKTEAEFEVQLGGNTPVGRTLEVLFEVEDGSGNIWEKTIRMQVDGPNEVSLSQNFPNPFNPSTIIRFELPEAIDVRLEVYDMLGRRVAQLVNERMIAGTHDVHFDASSLASGVYMYRLQTGGKVMNRQMILIK